MSVSQAYLLQAQWAVRPNPPNLGSSSEPPKLPRSTGLKGLIGGWELQVNCCDTHYSMHSYTLPFQESAKKTVITGKTTTDLCTATTELS